MASTKINRISLRAGIIMGMFSMTGLLSGCVSYTNVPVPASAPAFKSANHLQSISVVTKALETVIVEHPVVGQYAINLPVGTTPASFERVIEKLPDGAIVPIHGMSEDVPVYHIGRIWIRASDAKVDVVYPFERADGVIENQSVTIWLSGGVRRWQVYREQYWAAGTIPTPPVYVPIKSVEESDDQSVEEPIDQVEEPIEDTEEQIDE